MSVRPVYTISIFQEDSTIAVLEDAHGRWIDSVTMSDSTFDYEIACGTLGSIIGERERASNAN